MRRSRPLPGRRLFDSLLRPVRNRAGFETPRLPAGLYPAASAERAPPDSSAAFTGMAMPVISPS